jgi:mannosyltransferase
VLLFLVGTEGVVCSEEEEEACPRDVDPSKSCWLGMTPPASRGGDSERSGRPVPPLHREITPNAWRPGTRFTLAALVAVAAAIRLSTLGIQSYWDDEAATVFLLKLGFWKMLQTIPKTESTPPLYYVLAWVWAKIFGTGEPALRSLSALFGVATVPVVYAAAKELVSRRAALVAAALVACNPFLVWYSQEARSYALYTFLGALSFFFFVRFLREGHAVALWCWAIASTLALSTHYFAVFLVAPEAAWLVLIASSRRAAALTAVVFVASAGLALLPLARHQQAKPELTARRASLIHSEAAHHYSTKALGGGGISETPLAGRVVRIPKEFLVGLDIPAEIEVSAVAGLLALAAIWLLVRRAVASERCGANVAASIGMAMIAIPIALALVGEDYLLPYYLIGAIVPLAIATAAGFAATRTGLGLAGALCLLSLAVIAFVSATPRYQRENWRGAARALGPARVDRAVVVTPSDLTTMGFDTPLPIYEAGLQQISREGAEVRELDILGVRVTGAVLPRQLLRAPSSSFRPAGRVSDDSFTLLRFVSQQPVHVSRRALLPSHFGDWPPHRVTVFIQHTQHS